MSIVHISSASSIVAGWLSKSGGSVAQGDAADTSATTAVFAPRPERLGLGAKFVPHSATLSVDEQRFSKKLKAQSLQPQQVHAPTHSPRRQPQQPKALHRKLDRTSAQDESDDDEESRTASFKLKGRRNPQQSSQKKRRR